MSWLVGHVNRPATSSLVMIRIISFWTFRMSAFCVAKSAATSPSPHDDFCASSAHLSVFGLHVAGKRKNREEQRILWRRASLKLQPHNVNETNANLIGERTVKIRLFSASGFMPKHTKYTNMATSERRSIALTNLS